METKKRIVFDIECLVNYFCVVMVELEGDREHRFYIHKHRNDSSEIIEVCKRLTMIGYNNHGYDDILINYLMMNPDCTNMDLYNLSKSIIERNKTDEQRRLVNKYKYLELFDSIDVMTMLASSALRVSLKHLQVVIKWRNVHEFEVDWDKPLKESRWEDCSDYCLNDVLSLKAVCETLGKDFELRDYVQRTTGIECRSKDPVKISEYAMCDAIARGKNIKTDKFIKQAIDKNVPTKEIVIKDLLNERIEFKTIEFQRAFEVYKNFILNPVAESKKPKKQKFQVPVILNGIKFNLGLGGCHHDIGKSITHKAKDGVKLLQSDVSSYYPSYRIKYLSHRFDPWFLAEYKQAYADKANAKKAGDKMLEGYAKLRLNSVFGLYNSLYSPLYQSDMAYGTTINCQLFLCMLIEALVIAKFDVVGANTDAVNVYVPDERWTEYLNICCSWENLTQMKLDHDEFAAIYEQSCNNYIAVTPEGYVKAKGTFVDEPSLLKGYSHPVTKKALIAYFTKGVPIEKYIKEHTDIYDFCMSTRMGTAKNGNKFEAYHNGIKLQRTNRYYASTGEGSAYMYKSSDTKNMQHVLKDSGVTVFNKFEKREMKDYKINYKFYEKICRDIINKIEPSQLNLF